MTIIHDDVQESFAKAISAGVKSVADAFRGVLSQLGQDFPRPTDLQLFLKVDYRACWQVLTLARAEDPFSVVHHVPTIASVKRVLKAARAKGVTPETTDRVNDALEHFETLVASYASDRTAFDAMVAAIAGGEAASTVSTQNRRAAYRAEVPIWGHHCGLHYAQFIMRAIPETKDMKVCVINLKQDLTRLRSDVMPVVHQQHFPRETPRDFFTPFDPEAMKKYNAPLIPRFSTHPLPQLKTTASADGWEYTALASSELGRKGTSSLAFGGMVANYDQNSPELPFFFKSHMFITLPTEKAVLDIIVDRTSGFAPKALKFIAHQGRLGNYAEDQHFLIDESYESLGPLDKAPALPAIHHHKEMLQYPCDTFSWNPADFDLFRVQLAYPVLHSAIRFHFERPAIT